MRNSTRVTAILLCLAACGPADDESRDPRRFSLAATGVDTSDFIVSDIVKRQRALFSAMSVRAPIDSMTERMFTIHDDSGPTPSKQAEAATKLLRIYGIPIPLDTVTLAKAGDLERMASFEVSSLPGRQIRPSPSGQDGPVTPSGGARQRST